MLLTVMSTVKKWMSIFCNGGGRGKVLKSMKTQVITFPFCFSVCCGPGT